MPSNFMDRCTQRTSHTKLTLHATATVVALQLIAMGLFFWALCCCWWWRIRWWQTEHVMQNEAAAYLLSFRHGREWLKLTPLSHVNENNWRWKTTWRPSRQKKREERENERAKGTGQKPIQENEWESEKRVPSQYSAQCSWILEGESGLLDYATKWSL